MPQKKRNSKDTVDFTFICRIKPEAKKVFIAGDFNNWNPESDRMTRRNGTFRKRVKLAKGDHQYKFIIDGEWCPDPAATQIDNAMGSVNSLVHI